MESSDLIEVDDSSEPPGTSMPCLPLEIFSTYNHAAASTTCHQEEVVATNGIKEDEDAYAEVAAPEAKNETLADILSDLPSEVLTSCGPEEAFAPNYREKIFPRSRPPGAPVTEPTTSVFHEEEVMDPDDNFYFESDHLALKGNKDYRNLLKVVVTLQAQRTQAIKDLDVLLMEKKKALEDPIAYVAKLQSGDLPEYPGPQKIAELPEIDWTKYNVAQPDGNMRPQTRHAKTAPQPRDNAPQEEEGEKLLIRGRAFDGSKPETFNKLWTTDEQRRLEELLIEYPPEEVEMRRWTKIANALGNRTPKQVSSRVQKYFLKLTKAGLPIPGRGPKVKSELRKSTSRYRNQSLLKKSTFFPHEQLLDEIKKEPTTEELMISDDSTPATSVPEENPEQRQIELLRQVKVEKDTDNEDSNYHNLGYKCYICCEDPLKGIRWHCEVCPDEVDLCSDCAIAQLEAEDPIHPSTHTLTAIRPPKYSQCYDADYLPQNFSTTSYNYLDPNFLPE
ncbi:hypothetical protein TSAR_007057 [Trichomalopsis sarcophagae]|uniref:Uncharacterized protein n=1 Tax=Trichomalopsis sarcophagae TaxID=543379 RepID=A0A232FNG8_9HYME|nr:hypothetical protein TSAR_007057 [Trichomalopsis sarcophagae]